MVQEYFSAKKLFAGVLAENRGKNFTRNLLPVFCEKYSEPDKQNLV